MDYNTALLIHAGALLYIIAFLIRDELRLRLLVLAGSFFYLLYYFFYPDIPLWDAIISTAILTLANVIVLFRIILERTMFGLGPKERQLFQAFEGFSPGQFRQLLKIGRWTMADQLVTLTAEKQPLAKLYYIVDGTVEAQKGAHSFALQAGTFIGEIAFVLDGLPTATVTAPAGTDYIEWDSAAITALMDKSTAFENAMMALLSRDLADKLATSIQPQIDSVQQIAV